VIPNAVDLERFRPAERSPARAALGILASDFVVGFAGRLQAVKNLPVLARAAAAAEREVPDLRLLIVGDGEERGKIEALIAELGLANRVSFLGMRRDLPAIYPAMDVFCLPSRAEGCSRVLLEAAACALPLVATPVGSAPELVGRAEEAGLLVPVDDAAALAGALVRLARSAETRQVMAAAARKRAERWGLAEHVRKIEQLYTELWEVHAR
jgi:glycosyltransferase involved in cell wall biosynthesis